MENIIIQPVSVDDIALLQDIGRQTFSETFAACNTAENMSQYLEAQFSKEKLVTELRDANSLFFFALLNNKPVGYLKLNTGMAQTELKAADALEIERIYVLKEFHGKKLGQLLYEKAMQVAAQKGVTYVWLGVWEENTRALGFYKKNGFEAFDKHVFRLGEDEQTDIMMKKILQ